jgi:hypothetical protein
MADGGKIVFRITNTSDPRLPFKTVSVPPDTPFVHVVRFVCNEFKVSPETAAVLTRDHVGVNPSLPAKDIFLRYGAEFSLIPRDRVGATV